MAPKGFEPVAGSHFTFQTTPAGEWDGTIHCEVLEVVPNERLSYAWKGGHEAMTAMAQHWRRWSPSPFQGRDRHAPAPGPFRLCASGRTTPPTAT